MGNKELEGVAASPPGRRPFGVEPASAVSSEAGTPNAWTPGPWRVGYDPADEDGGIGFPREGEGRDEIACLPHQTFSAIDIFTPPRGPSHDEHFANARLIAAAPDMFEALEKLVDAVRFDVDKVRRIERAEAILAKARGEQP